MFGIVKKYGQTDTCFTEVTTNLFVIDIYICTYIFDMVSLVKLHENIITLYRIQN